MTWALVWSRIKAKQASTCRFFVSRTAVSRSNDDCSSAARAVW
jgi:hypothetical protein